MTSRRPAARRLGLLLAVLAGLALAWSAWPATVPLYDGVGFPDEPYRFVDPPPGYQASAAPTTGTGSSAVSNGINLQSVVAQSAEQGPQVVVAIVPGDLHVPAGATKVTLRARPVGPDVQPAGGDIDGNLYRVSAGTDVAGTVTFQPSAGATGSASSGITMRATAFREPGPVMVYRPAPGARWQPRPTERVGNDVYRTSFAGLGDYALAFGLPQPGAGGSGGSGGGLPLAWLLVAALAVALVALVVAVRISRGRAGREPPPEPAAEPAERPS
ncbi:MAG: hypothetical protein ACJ74O_16305 [Frankiaceae bacterium]